MKLKKQKEKEKQLAEEKKMKALQEKEKAIRDKQINAFKAKNGQIASGWIII